MWPLFALRLLTQGTKQKTAVYRYPKNRRDEAHGFFVVWTFWGTGARAVELRAKRQGLGLRAVELRAVELRAQGCRAQGSGPQGQGL